ncbi:site-2 protease family protein [Pseudomonas sp. Pseusp97]|uniref:site-2 protease family protein n=1 Tax=Pseudomonas sp. Pseusp97 TaxID=3243065 RepID=UPI0039A63A37
MSETGMSQSRICKTAGLWSLPEWLNTPLRMLMIVLGGAAGALGMVLSMLALPTEPVWIVPGLLLGLVAIYQSIFVHEFGHFLGARLGGMTVMRLRVGRWDFRMRRRGWTFSRQPRHPQKLAGYVMAFADPRGPWRRQHVWFNAGGPLANLLVAGLAGLVSLTLEDGPAQGLLIAVAATNTCMGVANLLPVQGKLKQVSDGLWMLRWWRGMDAAHPQLAFARLMGLSCSGLCADQVPEADLQLLESQEAPMPLVALYIRLRALQVQGRWEDAAALDASFQAQRNALPEALQKVLYDMLRLIGAELAFAQAVASGGELGLFDELLPQRLQHEYTSIWARCLAMRAAIAGDQQEFRRQLERAVAFARLSPDLSQETEELRMQQHLLKRLPA